MQTGIPEQTGSIDYVFLDPPHDFYPRGTEPEFSPATALSETMTKFKTILRESFRILKSGGRISVIVESTVGRFGIVDFPFEVTRLARELGFASHGKVYLPRRSDAAKSFGSPETMKNPLSECRELLTFEKQ
jgi:predicted methyltransferase